MAHLIIRGVVGLRWERLRYSVIRNVARLNISHRNRRIIARGLQCFSSEKGVAKWKKFIIHKATCTFWLLSRDENEYWAVEVFNFRSEMALFFIEYSSNIIIK